jgi:hypothetical protein
MINRNNIGRFGGKRANNEVRETGIPMAEEMNNSPSHCILHHMSEGSGSGVYVGKLFESSRRNRAGQSYIRHSRGCSPLVFVGLPICAEDCEMVLLSQMQNSEI